MKKVLVIVPFPMSAANRKQREAQLDAVELGPDISFHFRPVRAGPANYTSDHDSVLADISILDAGKRAQEEGYDAVCIDTMSDSGLAALRSILDIPVIGPGRAAMLTALMLGERFSILIMWDRWRHLYKKSILELGLTCAHQIGTHRFLHTLDPYGTADPGLTTEMLPAFDETVRALHMGTCALVFEPSGSTLEALFLRERTVGTRFLALDPNVRLGLVGDLDTYRGRIERMIAAADLVKVSDADIEALWPGDDIIERVAVLARTGPGVIVLTRGGDALLAFRSNGDTVPVPAERVEVVDTIGAGDTANAAMLAWLTNHDALSRANLAALSDDQVTDMLRFAARAAAITCSRAGANPPWASELV